MSPGRRALVLPAALLLFLAAASSAEEKGAGSVVGSLRLPFEEAAIAQLGPIVAYLEPLEPGRAAPATAAPGPPTLIRQKNARFAPAFAVVTVGESVEMVNDDFIFHNVFSYSKPNDFDLGVYPSGESRFVVFRTPGVVKTYCSIHESMNGTLFVAPTRYHALVEPDGRFEIGGVPAGRFRLATWSEKLPVASRVVEVVAGRRTRVDLEIAAPGS